MMERTDYWRGFTGGLITGVAIGAWIYLSPRMNRQTIDFDGFDRETPEKLPQRQKSMGDATVPSLRSSPMEAKGTGS